MLLSRVPVVRTALAFAAVLAVAGCDSEEPGPAKPSAAKPEESKPEEPAKPLPQVSPTDNDLPPQLEGLHLGMSLGDFKGLRDTKNMGVHAFESSMVPDVDGGESMDVLMAKFDAAEENAKKIKSPDWPGTKGLYYLEETFDAQQLRQVRYTFSDGVLHRVIAYYDSPEVAVAVATGLRGTPARAGERLTISKEGDTPEFQTWVYKERYVARTTKPSAEPAAASEKTSSFNLGPLRSGSFSPVAKLTFDAKQVGTLEVLEAGADADRLEAEWKVIAKQDVVQYKGHEGDALVGISTRRGEAGYPAAAAEALSQKAGQFASPL